MAKKGGRVPKFAALPDSNRRARIAQEPGESYFGWRSDSLDFGGPWGWHRAHPCHVHQAIIPILQAAEQRTWTDVLAGKSTGGANEVPVGKLHREAQNRLSLLQIDEDNLFEFKVDHKLQRVWGIRDGRYFRLLWWDPKHEIYSVRSDKKDRRRPSPTVKPRDVANPGACPFADGAGSGRFCRHCDSRQTPL